MCEIAAPRNTKITLAATWKITETWNKNPCFRLIETYKSYALTSDKPEV